MAKRRKPSQKPIKELLAREGYDFEPDSSHLLGASDSAHQAEIGRIDGEEMVVKPFRSKKGFLKAQNELAVTALAKERGIRTPEPVEVVNLKQLQVALYISKYVPDLIGAHTLSYEEDPNTPEGQAVGQAVRSQVSAIANLHSKKITHGDAQPKNIHFVSYEALTGSDTTPYIIDLENGIDHSKPNASALQFKGAMLGDISRLGVALGARQYGGYDQPQAEDAFRENVIEHYLQSSASDMLGRPAANVLIDDSMQSFQEGRDNKALHTPVDLSRLV